jgi:methionine biosynthesis protein MetW
MTADQRKRRDLDIVAGLIAPHSRVLDLGCGDGGFLRQLQDEKHIHGLGVEIDQQMVGRCIANGIHVIQRDLDSDLDFAENGSFDFVILSQTIQEVRRPDQLLREIVRVGKRAVVSIINFGHLPCRLSLLVSGRMPENEAIPYHWYDTPNIHLGTLFDFRRLCHKLGISITTEIPVGSPLKCLPRLLPNLLAPSCVFELEKRHKTGATTADGDTV